MANTNPSPAMSLPIPVPGVDPGPDYANQLNNCLTIIDTHNHTAGSGVQIPTAGININADLPFNSFNAISLRSVRLNVNTPAIPASGLDLGIVYRSGADLFYNDGNGNQIQITASGSVAGSSGTITGLPSGTASASFSAASGTFVFQQATSTAANTDIGTLLLRYPGSYPTPSGNYIALQAPTSLSSGYALTLPAVLPVASHSFLTASTAGALSYTTVDGTTLSASGSTISVATGGITNTQMAAASVGGAAGGQNNIIAGSLGTTDLANASVTPVKRTGVAVGFSSGSGGFNNGGTNPLLIAGTGLYTLTGSKAMAICLQAAFATGTSDPASISLSNNGTSSGTGFIALYANYSSPSNPGSGTLLATWEFTGPTGQTMGPFPTYVYAPGGGGSYTLGFFGFASTGSTVGLRAVNLQAFIYELG